MKPIYITLCKLNEIREAFVLDLYRALVDNKRALLPKDIYNIEPQALKLSEEGCALLRKVYAMVYGGDLATVLRMLYSFRFGVKKLNTHLRWGDHEEQYYYRDVDGNEKCSHKGNLPKAHFRWDYGKRYILSEIELKRIEDFLGAIFPPDIHYKTRKK